MNRRRLFLLGLGAALAPFVPGEALGEWLEDQIDLADFRASRAANAGLPTVPLAKLWVGVSTNTSAAERGLAAIGARLQQKPRINFDGPITISSPEELQMFAEAIAKALNHKR